MKFNAWGYQSVSCDVEIVPFWRSVLDIRRYFCSTTHKMHECIKFYFWIDTLPVKQILLPAC